MRVFRRCFRFEVLLPTCGLASAAREELASRSHICSQESGRLFLFVSLCHMSAARSGGGRAKNAKSKNHPGAFENTCAQMAAQGIRSAESERDSWRRPYGPFPSAGCLPVRAPRRRASRSSFCSPADGRLFLFLSLCDMSAARSGGGRPKTLSRKITLGHLSFCIVCSVGIQKWVLRSLRRSFHRSHFGSRYKLD